MRLAHGIDEVRAAEGATGALLTDGVLMQRAATAVAGVAADLLGRVYGARVVLVVGSGGNGGDALFAGAQLARRGSRVDAVLVTPSAHPGGLAALRRAGGRVIDSDTAGPISDEALAVIGAADLVVDGVAGLGSRPGLPPVIDALFDEVPPGTSVLAVDLPSGIDAGTGEAAEGAVVADVTVTFGTDKPGLLVDPGALHAGQVLVADIGLGPYLTADPVAEVLDAEDVTALLRRPRATDDKYARGVVGVIAGSEQYGGAGVLTVAGALATGPGMVRFAGQAAVADAVRAAHPEAIVTELPDAEAVVAIGRVQAWVVGPGGGTDERAGAVLAAALASDLPVVVDADGLSLLAADPDLARLVVDRHAPTVLTPHAGELARLLGVGRDEVEARRFAHVCDAADHFAATVLLKGSTTIVARAGRPARINPRATPWLATAGAGDVLSGVIGALLAAGLDAVDAASAGAWLHAAAGELAAQGGPIRAGDLAEALPVVVASLLEPAAAEDSDA